MCQSENVEFLSQNLQSYKLGYISWLQVKNIITSSPSKKQILRIVVYTVIPAFCEEKKNLNREI